MSMSMSVIALFVRSQVARLADGLAREVLS
jgi:hypothetical protein